MERFQLIQKIEHHGLENVQIRIVRDDLFPFLGGGNKARKMQEIEKEIKKKGANAMVTTGGIQSNHCRAAALTAVQNGWPCHLVLHGKKERFYNEKGNALLMRKAEAIPLFVEPEEISDAMDNAMISLKNKGYHPFYVQGGGHMVAGARAYAQAVQNLKCYIAENNWVPDAIFLASGTGSTQAGILAGLALCGLQSVLVYGISVARAKEKGETKIVSLLDKMSKEMDYNVAVKNVHFFDDWVSGGYEHRTPELSAMTDAVFKRTGILLDETYSGKAWLGMRDMIKNNAVSGNILFWHTGGLLNIMA